MHMLLCHGQGTKNHLNYETYLDAAYRHANRGILEFIQLFRHFDPKIIVLHFRRVLWSVALQESQQVFIFFCDGWRAIKKEKPPCVGTDVGTSSSVFCSISKKRRVVLKE